MQNNNNNIIPVVSYSNADKDKFIVYKENKNKSGIYRWNNLITRKSYIGSSISLGNRLSSYYSLAYLRKRVRKGSSIIYNSLLKHGYSNFSLDILEYCDPAILIAREQYYIDLLKPEYNILKIAGSCFGYKHTEESIKKMKGNRDSEFRAKMSIIAKLRYGKETSMYGKNHTNETKIKMQIASSIPVKITNIKTGKEKIIKGNLQAAKYLNMGESTLRRYKKESKIWKGLYLITNV